MCLQTYDTAAAAPTLLSTPLPRCHRIRSKYGDKVGSCFPELVRELDLDQ
jgi:hypothetical protein